MSDAPIPIVIETMTPEKENESKEEKVFNFVSDKNNSFDIKLINYINYIEIKAYLKDIDLRKEYYERRYNLEELKYNKFLSICDSIDEVYEQIIYELQKNTKKNVIEKNHEIKIIIPIEHIKIKEMIFELPEKIKKEKELIQELFVEIKNLNENKNKTNQEIIDLKNEMNKLKNDINLFRDENEKMKEKNNLLEKQIKNILVKIENNNNSINNENKSLCLNNPELNKSSIINDDIIKQNIIINWIKESINKTNINFELIFKMSVNGSDSEKFHKYCDNKGPTLLLIKTTKNKIFGGFTPYNWNSKKGEIRDKNNQTFIFSLNLLRKYYMLSTKKEAIICGPGGPVFGCDDIMLQFDMKKGETYANEFCNFLSNKNLELIDEKGNKGAFETKEMEVFKVVY